MMNLKRSLFAVWQEYQGTGLLGGMGHAAALPREIVIVILSKIFPPSLIRYILTFFMLFLGGTGTYLLSHDLLFGYHFSTKIKKFIALLSACFVIVSPLTQHLFAVPFEAFVTHFAALSLLIWSARRLLLMTSKRHIIYYIFFSLFLSTHAYIPTLFVTYLMILGVIILSLLIQIRNMSIIKSSIVLLLLTFFLNAYWLLPFSYFTVTESNVTVQAKINQMSTEEIFLRNKTYGSLHNIITQQSFWIDTFDLSTGQGGTVPILRYWNEHKNSPGILIIGYGISIIIFCALTGIIVKRRKKSYFLIPLLLLILTMIITQTPPFSVIGNFLRNSIPLFNQAFRFPFTKWGLATVWIMGILFAMGMAEIYSLFASKRSMRFIISILFTIPLVWYAYPMVTNQFMYPAMRQTIPNYYFDLFSYFNSQPAGRIANFPQPTYWGWTFYTWGYTGSGFPWYGIEQPMLDRAFDVWSKNNEQYYWEINHALYTKNPQELSNILLKYDIRYIIIDDSIISSSHNRALFKDELIQLMSTIPSVSLVGNFGPIRVYKNTTPSTQFGYISTNVPSIQPYVTWVDKDQAAQFMLPYKDSSIAQRVYPFQNFFTKRSVEERTFEITEDSQSLVVKGKNKLSIAEIDTQLTEATPSTSLSIQNSYPIATISKLPLYDSNDEDSEHRFSSSKVIPCGVHEKAPITIWEESQVNGKTIGFRTTDQRACFTIPIQNISHRYGYILSVDSLHIEGRQLLLSVINSTAKHSTFETFLPTDKQWRTSYFVLPPLGSDGLGYSVYFSNDSIGQTQTTNILGNVRLFSFPYEQVTSFSLGEINTISTISTIDAYHPNSSYYKFLIPETAPNSTLLLMQAFHPGWNAYNVSCSVNSLFCTLKEMFPFLFGSRLSTHVLINSWANGWELPNDIKNKNSTIVIYFLPQLLEWIGLVLLVFPLFFVINKTHQQSNTSKFQETKELIDRDKLY